MNYIWAGLLAVGFLAGMLNGRIEEVTNAAFASAAGAVELSIGLLGMMCLWSGLMKIMEKSGMTNFIAKAAQPILRPLFPELEDHGRAMGAIVMNMSANFMGLGNAATPFGIKAMEELQKLNRKKDTATDAMCMFLVLNTSALQFIPTTVLAIRSDAGSAAPSEVIICIWAASIFAAIAGILAAKILTQVWRPRMSAGAKSGRASALKRCRNGPTPMKQYRGRSTMP
jgi:spore maturation protein A